MEQASILIVDDEKAIVKMLEMTLKKEGFQNIFTAHTGREALSIVEKQKIDIIILDVMLPDESGFDECPKFAK